VHFQLAPVTGRRQARLEEHHRIADGDGGEEVNQGQGQGAPEGMDLHPQHHQQRPQGGLVHHGQHGPQGDEEEHHLVELFALDMKAPLFQEGGGKLDPHDADVDGDTGRHLKHHRIGGSIARGQDVPEVPPTAQVEDHPHPGQGIAEEGGQQGWPDQGMVFPPIEDVDQHGHGKTAAGEGGTDDHVAHHPEAPGETVVQVGDGPQTEEETHQEDRQGHPDQGQGHIGNRVEDAAAHRGGRGMGTNGHECLLSDRTGPWGRRRPGPPA